MKNLLVIASCVLLLTACQNMDAQTPAQKDLSHRKSSLRRIAESVKQSGDVQAAAQMEAQLIEMDQKDPNSFIALANTVKQYGKPYDVIDVLQTGEEINPDSSLLKIELAKAYLQASEPENALKKVNEVSDDKSRDFYNTKGVALDLTGQYAQAQEVYAEGLKYNQRDSLLLNNMALSKLLTRDYDSAIPILEELAQRNSDSKYANNLALAYGMKGDYDKAKRILGRTLSPEEIEENLRIYKEVR